MDILNAFNNRELAAIVWVFIILCISLNYKAFREFYKESIPLLFHRKFLGFYLICILYYLLALYFLYQIGFWEKFLLKESIIWAFFVQFPLFAHAIEKADNNRFFQELIKNSLKMFIVVEFLLNFWTFGFIIEFILVPVMLVITILSTYTEINKEHKGIKKVADFVLSILGLAFVVRTIIGISGDLGGLLSINPLKELFLPFILLIMLLPLTYGLALFSMYEQIFVQLKGQPSEKKKMRRSIVFFCGVDLNKVTAVRKNIYHIMESNKTNLEFKLSLRKFADKLSFKVGDNYMKRSNYYIRTSILWLLLSSFGLIFLNPSIESFKVSDFILSIELAYFPQILIFIFAISIPLSLSMLFFGLGMRSEKKDQISDVKRYVLYDLFFIINKQKEFLLEEIPIDSPKLLYLHYISFALELKKLIRKKIWSYDNLLATWEYDCLQQLSTSVGELLASVKLGAPEFDDAQGFNVEIFNDLYIQQKKEFDQNEKLNVYTYGLEESTKKYAEQIKKCANDLKQLLPTQ